MDGSVLGWLGCWAGSNLQAWCFMHLTSGIASGASVEIGVQGRGRHDACRLLLSATRHARLLPVKVQAGLRGTRGRPGRAS